MPKEINTDDLELHVVVYNKAMNAHHYCTKHQYANAAKQDGYDWELKTSFETEAECQEFISEQTESSDSDLSSMTVASLKAKAAELGLDESEFKNLKKAELVELLTGKI